MSIFNAKFSPPDAVEGRNLHSDSEDKLWILIDYLQYSFDQLKVLWVSWSINKIQVVFEHEIYTCKFLLKDREKF